MTPAVQAVKAVLGDYTSEAKCREVVKAVLGAVDQAVLARALFAYDQGPLKSHGDDEYEPDREFWEGSAEAAIDALLSEQA